MKPKLLFIAFVSAILIATNAKAQTDTSKLTVSHLAAARELISTTGATEIRYTSMRQSIIKALSKSIPEKNQGKFVQEIDAFFDKYLPSDRFKEDFVKIYAETFTEDELKQLVTFYKSPIGRKISENLPKLMEKVIVMDQQNLLKHSEELQSIINEAAKE